MFSYQTQVAEEKIKGRKGKPSMCCFACIGCTEPECEGCHCHFSDKPAVDLTDSWLLNVKQQTGEQYLH